VPLVDLNDPLHLGVRIGAEPDGHPNTRNGVFLVYPRKFVLDMMRERWAWLAPALGLTATSSLIIVGCAYGYQIEALAELGITRVIGTETSTAMRTRLAQSEDAEIQAALAADGLTHTSGRGQELYNLWNVRAGQARSARAADILNEDLANNGSRNNVRNAIQAKGGTSWDVITENVLTVLSDAECTTLAGRARSLSGISRLIHLVSTTTPKRQRGDLSLPPIYNWKSVAEWKALIPADTFVSLYTREIL
jgi:SAM-dependent methyltransferase